MDWNKIMEPMMTRPDQGWRLAVIEAMQEYDRQHLVEHHGQEPVVENCDYRCKVDTDYSNWMYCPTCGKLLR